MRIKNITLDIPQRVCSHLSIRPIVENIDALSCNTYVEVFDKEVQKAVVEGVEIVVSEKKTVCWTGNVPITEEQYALCKNNKTLLEDYVCAYLGLERRP